MMILVAALCMCLGLVSGAGRPEPPSCGYGCMNGGMCDWTGNSEDYNCVCQDGYTGRFCEMQICSDEGSCSNNGNCEDDGYGNMFCNCNAEYAGFYCETQISCIAPAEECVNGGYCMSDSYGEHCQCPDGYTGVKCEKVISPCTSCLVNVTCDVEPCECQGWDCQDPGQMYHTTCVQCEGTEYDECNYNPWNSPTMMCEEGCMSKRSRTGDGMWVERGCANDECWNGCDEHGMGPCVSCCYDDYCNAYDADISAGRSLLGISMVGASMACILAIIVA
ncbi:protein glp-1-like [Saccoglossus kowalevskii]|uniref:Neurogenic locus notch homolog protein 1-like n=1 Tax=Saccoglossus kowalevskii TaxID=10224 RepID=A0ABM0M993_SACKO|nr:PREDICTED: neurogenic locus notch homolog protein 1-like [Saccoglossus kowalevskii]